MSSKTKFQQVSIKKIGYEIELLSFLKDSLEKQLRVYHNYETRANYTIALSSGILVFAIAHLISKPIFTLGIYIIILTAFISLILSLLTLKPPKFMRKKRQKESLFYHNNISDLSFEDFNKKINKTIDSPKEIVKQYSMEIYNLATYSIGPRKIFSSYTTPILTVGLTIGIILILIEILF